MKIVRQTPKKWELYDLAKDPSETKDLIKEMPEQFQIAPRSMGKDQWQHGRTSI